MKKKRRVGLTQKYRLFTHCDRGEGYEHWHTHLRMKCSSVPGNILHKILTKMFNPRNAMLQLFLTILQLLSASLTSYKQAYISPLQPSLTTFCFYLEYISHTVSFSCNDYYLPLLCLINQMFCCSSSPFKFSQGFAGGDALKVTSLPFSLPNYPICSILLPSPFKREKPSLPRKVPRLAHHQVLFKYKKQ